MDCSTPGLPVHHQLLESTQTYVHQVNDAVQPSHLQLSPSPAFNLSQHQGLFQWVSSLHQVVKVLSFRFSISASSEYSGLISFRIDWFELLAVSPEFMWLSVNIYCAYAALSWRNKRMLMNVIYKIQMYSLHVEKDTVFTSVQSLSHVQIFATPWTAACQASLSITNSQSLPKLMSVESVMPSSHLILCRPLLSWS